MNFPQMARIRQNFNTQPIQDIAAAVTTELRRIEISRIIGPGQHVAITAGSRGIANIADVLKTVVAELNALGAKPFIFPAMGSHGGATAQGQAGLLAHYGITEENVGAPVRSSMEVVKISRTAEGIDVYVDKLAAAADHIVVINRIKTHTDFKADLESGLFKMMAIGMGKQQGADYYHKLIVRQGHFPVFLSVGREVLTRCPIAFGLGLVENQRDETAIIRAMPANQIEAVERQLLAQSKTMFPGIPFNAIDLLIVDWMGKEISGTGMDQNVIGRSVIPYHKQDKNIDIMRIFVRDLTDHSEGNATAVGNADFTTRRLVNKIDPAATYMNALTSSCPEAVRIPIHFDTDKEAVNAALNTIGDIAPERARIVHIRSTLQLEQMMISQSMIDDAKRADNVRIMGSPHPLAFDEDGNLISDL